MNPESGGMSSNDRQRQTAAEIARKKVLAAYSSTLDAIKNLPLSSKDILVKRRLENPSQTTPTTNSNWMNQPSVSNYQRPESGIYSTSTLGAQTPESPSTSYSDAPSDSIPNTQNSYYTDSNSTYSDPNSYYQNPNSSYQDPSPNSQDLNLYYSDPNSDYSSSSSNSDHQNSNSTIYPTKPTSVQPQPITKSTTPENPQTFYNTSDADYTPETNSTTLKDTPINQQSVDETWQQYHSAWQDYYKNYYNDYYSKAAQTYLATEKMKSERIASGQATRARRLKHALPFVFVGIFILAILFLQYNRLIFAPIMAYVSPDSGDSASSIVAIDPTITENVSPEPRLIIPKLNIDVPVAFSIAPNDVMSAMNQGVAQFSIPGANALPGQIGNLVISGHSAGDIYSNNPYKFIFSGLERLENGDLIYINYNSVRYTYQMTRREVVEPSNVAALIYDTDRPMLTLITCTPLGTSRYRLLITAEQISPSYANSETAAPTPETPDSEPSMPANEPSFFEKIWQGIFGN